MQVPLAFVHHANQYLITEGYDNREGLIDILQTKESRVWLSRVLQLHRKYKIAANIHISGTLLEAIAWHHPDFLLTLREMYDEGLIEIVGSCYSQNLMRFFGYDHNLSQLKEELRLYQIHMGLDPAHIKTFWPPERLWDTERMAPVLKDSRLINQGYHHVIVDDRLLLSAEGDLSPRHQYDREGSWDPELFRIYRIEHGHGLIAFPIANNLRQSIPPNGEDHWRNVQSQLQWLATLDPALCGGDLIAIYGDDMEKAAGVGGWDREGPSRFEALLGWVSETSWIKPVKLSEWASAGRIAGTRRIEVGTFQELANHFNAGEGYEKWYFDPQWKPYRTYFSWSESRLKQLSGLGADSTLIELAEKQLLASSWETAWHTPPAGPHGDPNAFGKPSPWIKALASHSRYAAVIAEAAFWMRHKDDQAHADACDILKIGRVIMKKPNKILIVLGDSSLTQTVRALPVCHAIRSRWPDTHLSVGYFRDTQRVFLEACPNISQLVKLSNLKTKTVVHC